LKTPLTFEEWKGSRSVQWSEDQSNALKRLHNMDTKKEFEEMLKNEYEEYLSDFNGSWLNK